MMLFADGENWMRKNQGVIYLRLVSIVSVVLLSGCAFGEAVSAGADAFKENIDMQKEFIEELRCQIR